MSATKKQVTRQEPKPKKPTPKEEILERYGNLNGNLPLLLDAILQELVLARLARG